MNILQAKGGKEAGERKQGPLRRAARLHTLWLSEGPTVDTPSEVARQAALLEGAVRCLAPRSADGGDGRALQHVLLDGALPGALAACRAALARDGIRVSVDWCLILW